MIALDVEAVVGWGVAACGLLGTVIVWLGGVLHGRDH